MRSFAVESTSRQPSVARVKLVALSFLLFTVTWLNLAVPARAAVIEEEARVQLGDSQVPVRSWSDNSIKTKGIIIAIHGAARHSGTYEALAEHLASLGYLVLSPDLRGHGQWYYAKWSTPEDKIADYDKSTDDAANLLTQMRNEHPQLPIFCVGESAGAAVAIKAATRCPSINGLILSAIGTTPCVHDVRTIFRDAIVGATNLNKPLDVREIITKYSSEDKKVREEAGKDPLGKDGLSARELLRTSWLLSRTDSFASKLPEHIPVLMLQGSEDEIVKASSARDVLKHISSSEKSYESFPCGHILLTTPFIRPDVLTSVSSWLVNRTAEQQTALLSESSTIK